MSKKIALIAVTTILAIVSALVITGCSEPQEHESYHEVACKIASVNGTDARLATGFIASMMVDGEPMHKFVENGEEAVVNIGAATILEGSAFDNMESILADSDMTSELYSPEELVGRIANVSIAGDDMAICVILYNNVTPQSEGE